MDVPSKRWMLEHKHDATVMREKIERHWAIVESSGSIVAKLEVEKRSLTVELNKHKGSSKSERISKLEDQVKEKDGQIKQAAAKAKTLKDQVKEQESQTKKYFTKANDLQEQVKKLQEDLDRQKREKKKLTCCEIHRQKECKQCCCAKLVDSQKQVDTYKKRYKDERVETRHVKVIHDVKEVHYVKGR